MDRPVAPGVTRCDATDAPSPGYSGRPDSRIERATHSQSRHRKSLFLLVFGTILQPESEPSLQTEWEPPGSTEIPLGDCERSLRDPRPPDIGTPLERFRSARCPMQEAVPRDWAVAAVLSRRRNLREHARPAAPLTGMKALQEFV